MSQETTDVTAPRPWRLHFPNKHYFQIVDAGGVPICEFFPESILSRGREATIVIAREIIERANAKEKGPGFESGAFHDA